MTIRSIDPIEGYVYQHRPRSLRRGQVIKGMILLLFYIAVRTLLSQHFQLYKGFESPLETDTLLLVGGMFVGGTILLIWGGMRWWVRLDFHKLFFRRGAFGGDLLWAIGTVVVLLMINIGVFVFFMELGLISPGGSQGKEHTITVAWIVLVWVYGFVVVAPQEEVLFRGFLQTFLEEQFGKKTAILLQALVYAGSYLGFFPLQYWFFILLPFLYGMVWGIVRERRRSLLPCLISHGIVG